METGLGSRGPAGPAAGSGAYLRTLIHLKGM
jgi:hypothetical protein